MAAHMPSALVVLSAFLVLLGAGGSLLTRVYFVHGGQRPWLSTMVQVAGWPLLLPPICAYLLLRHRRRRRSDGGVGIVSDADDYLLSPRLAGAVAALGAFYAVACLALSLGSQALPLSTSSLLQATQLAFNAVFSCLFAGLRFTPFSVNAVFLLTLGPAVLGLGSSLRSSPEKPQLAGGGGGGSSSSAAYWSGFLECMSSAAMLGLALPLVEAAVSRYGRRRSSGGAASYATVMQIQAVMGAAATAVCAVGMAVAGDFPAVPVEAAALDLGEGNYYRVLVFGAISWQLSNLGITGLIICSSSLLAGIMMALVLPLSEILAVIFLHEKLDGVKCVALVLSLWGFVSYLYGESAGKKKMGVAEEQQPESISCPLTASCDF